jgi:hypothetical protein
MSHADVLGLVHDGKIEGRFFAFGYDSGQFLNMPELVIVFPAKATDTIENRPENSALLLW